MTDTEIQNTIERVVGDSEEYRNTLGELTPPAPTVRQPPSTVTVIETVYFQSPGQQPSASKGDYSLRLSSDEQPYSRSYQVGPEWVELDVGWVEDCAVLQIRNLGTGPRSVIPTPQQLAVERAMKLEIGFDRNVTGLPVGTVTHLLVSVGESCRFQPVDPKGIKVRSPNGHVKVHVFAVPV